MFICLQVYDLIQFLVIFLFLPGDCFFVLEELELLDSLRVVNFGGAQEELNSMRAMCVPESLAHWGM